MKVITETTRGTPNGHFRLHPGTGARNLLGLIRLQPNTWHPNLLGLTFRQGGTCQSRPSDTYPEPIQEDTPPFGRDACPAVTSPRYRTPPQRGSGHLSETPHQCQAVHQESVKTPGRRTPVAEEMEYNLIVISNLVQFMS